MSKTYKSLTPENRLKINEKNIESMLVNQAKINGDILFRLEKIENFIEHLDANIEHIGKSFGMKYTSLSKIDESVDDKETPDLYEIFHELAEFLKQRGVYLSLAGSNSTALQFQFSNTNYPEPSNEQIIQQTIENYYEIFDIIEILLNRILIFYDCKFIWDHSPGKWSITRPGVYGQKFILCLHYGGEIHYKTPKGKWKKESKTDPDHINWFKIVNESRFNLCKFLREHPKNSFLYLSRGGINSFIIGEINNSTTYLNKENKELFNRFMENCDEYYEEHRDMQTPRDKYKFMPNKTRKSNSKTKPRS